MRNLLKTETRKQALEHAASVIYSLHSSKLFGNDLYDLQLDDAFEWVGDMLDDVQSLIVKQIELLAESSNNENPDS